jgi:hypothetical protein
MMKRGIGEDGKAILCAHVGCRKRFAGERAEQKNEAKLVVVAVVSIARSLRNCYEEEG